MKIYGVINMDVVGSRNIEGRDQFQSRLENYISLVSQKFSKILLVPISITLGDEWQLITDTPQECYNLIHQFQQLLWIDGIELYAGIGIGSLSTSINSDIRKMDGISFHKAREALIIAKRNTKPGKKSTYSGSRHNRIFFKSDPNLTSSFAYHNFSNIAERSYMEAAATSEMGNASEGEFSSAPGIDYIVNTIIDNNEILKSKMTRKQKEVYINYLKGSSYREMAKTEVKMGSIAAISQKLNAAEYFTIQHNHEVVKNLLKYISLLEV